MQKCTKNKSLNIFVLNDKNKAVKKINKQINFFFITLIINFFITFYTMYNYLDSKIFQNKQGIKLKIKEENTYLEKRDDMP